MLGRIAYALMMVLVLGVPVGLPVCAALGSPDVIWFDGSRIVGPAATTLALAGFASLIAVPLGMGLAIALERLAVPGRRLGRGLVVVGLFVPLPISAVAWQVVLGNWLPPLTLAPGEMAWRPWSAGLVPAAWVHGAAGLPWVVWIVSAGLRATDRGLEDDATLHGGPAMVFRRVLVPRAMLAAVAAGGWVAVQAITEVPVTDAMMVRTYAEEVYTRFVTAADGLAGAVAVTVPAWLAAAVVVTLGGTWVGRRYGEPAIDSGPARDLRVSRRVRFIVGLGVWLTIGVFAGLPLFALLWKAGGGATRGGWGLLFFSEEVRKVLHTDGRVLLGSFGSAMAAGVIASGFAWTACSLSIGSRGFTRLLAGFCVVLAVAPGPVVGLGLKAAIRLLVDGEEWLLSMSGGNLDFPPLRSLLYDQPSPVPAVWAAVVRYFPLAVAGLWPAVRGVPRGLRESAILDGLGAFERWKFAVAPLTVGAAGRAAIAVAALALGEVSASKLVNPPFRHAYILRLFDQMHYGPDATVATLCLVQLTATALLAASFMAMTEANRKA